MVVQKMVDAQVAGVLFTADPVSGRRTRAVLDASPGLGEAVVSGMVNPDHLAVEDGAVVDRRLGDKKVAVRALPGGGTEVVERDAAAEACVTDAQAVALAALGRRVEAHFGAPQDIEWALDAAGALWLTQARPITSLYPVPPSRDGALRAFVCASLAQGLTRPITPMGLAAFGVFGGTAGRLVGLPGPHTSDPVAPPPAFAPVGGRAFVDVTAVLRNPIGRTIATFVLKFMEARTGVVLRELLDDPAFAPVPHGRRRALRRIGPVLVRFRVPLVMAQAVASPAAASRRVARLGARAAAFPPSAPGATGVERLERATAALASALPAFPGSAPAFAAGFLMRGVARRLAGDDLDDVTMDAVLRSLPNNVTTEMDLQLWALAQRVRSDPESADVLGVGDGTALAARFHAGTLPTVLQDGLAEFLRRYGHRAVAEIDLGMPRWREQPEHVLGALANYQRLDDPAAAPDVRFAAGEQVAQRAVADVVARVRRRSRWRARAVGFALGRVRELVGLREAPKDHLVRLIALARDELAAVGAELAARGLLDDPGDVFFLDLHDVAAALGGADLRTVVGDPSRGVRARAAPPARAAGAALRRHRTRGPRPRRRPGRRRAGRLPGLGRHRHRAGARRPRPGRRAAGAGRGPRRTVHRPRLDTAVPHRGRARDGDGRAELARRRRRPRVRHPRGRGRPGGHRADRDRCPDHRGRRRGPRPSRLIGALRRTAHTGPPARMTP